MMEWIGLGALVPLLLCGSMCVVGAVAAYFGLRRTSDSSQDGPAAERDTDDWTEWFDGSPEQSRTT